MHKYFFQFITKVKTVKSDNFRAHSNRTLPPVKGALPARQYGAARAAPYRLSAYRINPRPAAYSALIWASSFSPSIYG